MRIRIISTLIILSLIAAACDQSPANGNNEGSNVMVASGADSIVTEKYTGVLPCIDCDGIETTVELKRMQSQQSGSFVMRQVYSGKKSGDTAVAYAGNWITLKESPDNPGVTVIELTLDKEGNKEFFKRKGKDILMLDKTQQEIPTLLNYTLARVN